MLLLTLGNILAALGTCAIFALGLIEIAWVADLLGWRLLIAIMAAGAVVALVQAIWLACRRSWVRLAVGIQSLKRR